MVNAVSFKPPENNWIPQDEDEIKNATDTLKHTSFQIKCSSSYSSSGTDCWNCLFTCKEIQNVSIKFMLSWITNRLVLTSENVLGVIKITVIVAITESCSMIRKNLQVAKSVILWGSKKKFSKKNHSSKRRSCSQKSPKCWWRNACVSTE